MTKFICSLAASFYAFSAHANFGDGGLNVATSSAVLVQSGESFCQVDTRRFDVQYPAFTAKYRPNRVFTPIEGMRLCDQIESNVISTVSADAFLLNDAQVAALPYAIMGVACVVSAVHGAAMAEVIDKNPAQSQGAGVGLGMVGGALSTYFGNPMAGGVLGIGLVWAAAATCHVTAEKAVTFLFR